MPTRDEMIKEIVSLVEESRDGWRKTAFYSDDDVMNLLEELYDRWEEAGRTGLPLDYATEEEITFLYKRALSLSADAGFKTFKAFVKRAITGER